MAPAPAATTAPAPTATTAPAPTAMTAPQPPPSPAPGHAESSWAHVELQVPERAWVRCCAHGCAHTHAPMWAHACRAELVCAREGVCRQERDAAAWRHGARAAPSQHMQGQEPGSAGNSPTRRRQRKPRASRAGTGKSSCGGDGGTQLGWGRRVGITAWVSPPARTWRRGWRACPCPSRCPG